jgi:hypothetical protein
MAKDFGSKRETIRRVLIQDLGKKCYRKIKVQKLKEDQKPLRKSCCIWIRKNIDRKRLERMMFTDEKIFTRNGYFNPKNDVVWADSRSDANDQGGLHEAEKYPVSVLVALGATWNGLTDPYFFGKGERLDGKIYHEVLLPFYKEEGDKLFGHQSWGFQQDGASAHTDHRAQSWCKENFKFFISKEKWPPNSPELNPLDYSIWDKISRHVQYQKVKTIKDLQREIKKAVMNVDVNYLREVIGSFLRRVYSVERHDGELVIEEFS